MGEDFQCSLRLDVVLSQYHSQASAKLMSQIKAGINLSLAWLLQLNKNAVFVLWYNACHAFLEGRARADRTQTRYKHVNPPSVYSCDYICVNCSFPVCYPFHFSTKERELWFIQCCSSLQSFNLSHRSFSNTFQFINTSFKLWVPGLDIFQASIMPDTLAI